MSHTQQSSVTPQHVAIIMDGNRRWARANKLEALKGHHYVANKVIQPLVERCVELKIPYLTLWAFSTENWHRDVEEVRGLMELFRQAFTKNAAELHEKGVKLNTIGDLCRFPQDIQDNISKWIETTSQNENITVTFALNYGGRDELVRAVNAAVQAQDNMTQQLSAEDISIHLDTKKIPDPDLIIRPGGEQRLSGFMPWQAVYAELYFTEVLMPDFSPTELDKAIEEYASRQRRFGA
ncbi:MAG: polyprenyl diphosphate synthase [bacterium]|nr:polyprenyl diphosphate synthase [bacterium]